MAASLPVIATEVGGTPEVVTAACGRLVPARNPEALADAIVELAPQHDLRCRLGRGARERVASRFTLDRMVDDYRMIYRRAAA